MSIYCLSVGNALLLMDVVIRVKILKAATLPLFESPSYKGYAIKQLVV